MTGFGKKKKKKKKHILLTELSFKRKLKLNVGGVIQCYAQLPYNILGIYTITISNYFWVTGVLHSLRIK